MMARARVQYLYTLHPAGHLDDDHERLHVLLPLLVRYSSCCGHFTQAPAALHPRCHCMLPLEDRICHHLPAFCYLSCLFLALPCASVDLLLKHLTACRQAA
jgi:hypothetical protein